LKEKLAIFTKSLALQSGGSLSLFFTSFGIFFSISSNLQLSLEEKPAAAVKQIDHRGCHGL
jgi:hypothetical protein